MKVVKLITSMARGMYICILRRQAFIAEDLHDDDVYLSIYINTDEDTQIQFALLSESQRRNMNRIMQADLLAVVNYKPDKEEAMLHVPIAHYWGEKDPWKSGKPTDWNLYVASQVG